LKRFSFRMAFVVCSAFTPFGMAVVDSVCGTEPAPRLAAAPRPALAFDQYLVNLGAVPPMDEVYARFRYVNQGERPVEIQGLEPSCGCMTPTLDKKVLQPGEAGEFRLRVSTANQAPGPQEFSVRMTYTDPAPR